jgi:glycosyltransferase involved in cell wall biosynthesis
MPLLRAVGFHCVARWRIRQAISFGRRHGAELVWAELYGDAVVLAQGVAEGMRVPFVGTIWDDPERWLFEGYDVLSRRFLRRRFEEALRAARYLSTAGEVMQRTYRQRYGVNSVILRHGFAAMIAPSGGRTGDDGIIVGFVGSAYGRETWMAFLSAVGYLNGLGKLPRIRLRVFGGGGFPYRSDGVEIEVRGWQPADVMLQEIAETDFCYLPYWFDPRKRPGVELSFPNKFETYLAAGRPILFHGPEYAGIRETIMKYGVGICIHSLSQDEIVSALERLIADSSLRDSLSHACAAAFDSEFNATAMMRQFAELIGVHPEILLGRMMEEPASRFSARYE